MRGKRWIPYRINPEVLERVTLTVEIEWNEQTEELEKKFFELLDEVLRDSSYRIKRFFQLNGLLEVLEVITNKGKVYRIQGAGFWNHLLMMFLEIEQCQANWIDCDWYYSEETKPHSHFHRAFRFIVFDRKDILLNQHLVLTTQAQVPALNQIFEVQERAHFEINRVYKKEQLKTLDELFPVNPIKRPKSEFWSSLRKLLSRYFLKNHRNR